MNRKDFEERASRQRDRGPMTPHQKAQRNATYRLIDKELASGQLEPCPFDGDSAAILSRSGSVDQGGLWLWVECHHCGVKTPSLQCERWKPGYGTFYADDDAVAVLVEEWNRRVR